MFRAIQYLGKKIEPQVQLQVYTKYQLWRTQTEYCDGNRDVRAEKKVGKTRLD